MIAKIDKLEIRERTFESIGNGQFLTFFDFQIDGVSLYDALGKTYITLLSSKWTKSSVKDAIERLLGQKEGDLPGGRTSLYICPECGDVSDGVFSVMMKFEPNKIALDKFDFQNDEPGFDLMPEIPHFTFDREQYEATIKSIKNVGKS